MFGADRCFIIDHTRDDSGLMRRNDDVRVPGQTVSICLAVSVQFLATLTAGRGNLSVNLMHRGLVEAQALGGAQQNRRGGRDGLPSAPARTA